MHNEKSEVIAWIEASLQFPASIVTESEKHTLISIDVLFLANAVKLLEELSNGTIFI